MIRTFKTHKIRKQTELTQLWDFIPKDGCMPLKVAVPSCWESYPGFANYRGKATYQTVFEGAGNLRVVCKGVSHTADVFLDGCKIAHHYNAYTAFDGVFLEAAAGSHMLRIEVDNAFSEASALHIPNDYMTYGGITRPIVVEELTSLFIEWVHAVPVCEAGTWSLQVKAKIRNINTSLHVAELITDLNGQICVFDAAEVQPGECVIVSAAQQYRDLETYEPENPVLYLLECRLIIDRSGQPSDDLIERVGFREVSVSGGDVLINGKKLCLKGFCRHEDHPQFGCALPFPAIDYDLNQICDLGANTVRTVHYPNDELFLDLCDEKGILVWEENHARGLSEEQMHNPNFRTQCRDCIDEMVNQHFNHPSIIIWGILNECASETEYGKTCYAEQFTQIKALDTSRLTSFASCKHYTDISLDLVDIVSFNIYPEWYHNADIPTYIDELYAWIQASTGGKDKPLIISEIGAGGIFGYHGTNCNKWSEERQAEILSAQISAVLGKSYISGVYIWQYCDVRVCDEWFSSRPRTMNNKGIVDEYRRRKLAYPSVKLLLESYPNYR